MLNNNRNNKHFLSILGTFRCYFSIVSQKPMVIDVKKCPSIVQYGKVVKKGQIWKHLIDRQIKTKIKRIYILQEF